MKYAALPISAYRPYVARVHFKFHIFKGKLLRLYMDYKIMHIKCIAIVYSSVSAMTWKTT